jgi:hypothetical protein
VNARHVTPEDLPVIQDWISSRNGDGPDDWVFPTIGRVVDGLAAGFLYRTDSGIGLMELFASNPAANPILSGHAIEEVADAIIEDAEEAGLRGLMIVTKHNGIEQCAKRRHFVEEDGPWSVWVRRV